MKDIKLCISKDNKNWMIVATMYRSHDNLTYKNTNYGRFTQVKTGTKDKEQIELRRRRKDGFVKYERPENR